MEKRIVSLINGTEKIGYSPAKNPQKPSIPVLHDTQKNNSKWIKTWNHKIPRRKYKGNFFDNDILDFAFAFHKSKGKKI